MRDKIEKTKRLNLVLVVFWLVVLSVIASVSILPLVSEQRSDSGGVKEKEKTESVTCESDEMIYPYFPFDESKNKNLKIVTIVKQNQIQSIFLQYLLYYDDAELINNSENLNHTAMNLKFMEDGLHSDAMDATYAKLSDALKFSIYQTGDKIEEVSKKFFLLDEAYNYSLDGLADTYNKMGMDCKILDND